MGKLPFSDNKTKLGHSRCPEINDEEFVKAFRKIYDRTAMDPYECLANGTLDFLMTEAGNPNRTIL